MRLIPEGMLHQLMGRPGDLPTPGHDRWGKSKQLAAGESYAFIYTGYLPIITPIAVQASFSTDGVLFSPILPSFVGNPVQIDLIRAVDVKSGAFNESFIINPGEGLPFCTTIARSLNINVTNLKEGGGSIWVNLAACPVTTVDCDAANMGPWANVETHSYAADTGVGAAFTALVGSNGTKQVYVQNNTSSDLYLGFGTLNPAAGPPPVSNIILPKSIHAIWESSPGEFVGQINACFVPAGPSTEFATFTRGIT